MRLTKKHIGKILDTTGSDGSWWIELLDIKDNNILFIQDNGKIYKQENKYNDWRILNHKYSKKKLKKAWKGAKHA
jgi:hypothetical protein